MAEKRELRWVVITVSMLMIGEGFLFLWPVVGMEGIVGALLVLWGGKMWHAKLEVIE